jgi:hypothetical protein
MSWIARAGLAAALLNCAVLTAAAADPAGQWLKDPATSCSLFNADAQPGDSVTWSGACTEGFASGLGTASFSRGGKETQSFTATFQHGALADGPMVTRWGQGWSYEGEAVGGRFNGSGVLTTDQHDRFEGQWTDGRMNGFGVLRRADGERYAGDWKDDRPNGDGELRLANGTLERGLFADGKLVKAEAQATRAGAAKGETPFGGVSGKTLTGVDGSSIALNLIEGGMELQVSPADGAARKTTFTFMTDRMGTVVEGADNPGAGTSVTGFFRLTGKGVEVRYADGRSAMLSANPDGGVQMAQDSEAGSFCRNWYPAGHAFSEADKRAALNAYAGRLGLPVTAADNNGCFAAAPKPQAANPAPPVASLAPPAGPKPRPERVAAAKPAPRAAPASYKSGYRIGDYKNGALETVAVKSSDVHLIDGAAPPPDVAKPADAPADGNNASGCLKVDSDGGHWGFRNGCDFAVQFAYCMAGASDTLAACGRDAVPGSVAAHGFGALIADASLKEQEAEHGFRWIACGGGAGEVVPHLDRFEPPAGRCERTAAN